MNHDKRKKIERRLLLGFLTLAAVAQAAFAASDVRVVGQVAVKQVSFSWIERR